MGGLRCRKKNTLLRTSNEAPATNAPVVSLTETKCAESIVRSRSQGRYSSVDDLVLRVPQLNRKEFSLLANVGALNTLDGVEHRRDALWQVERAGRPEGPLLMQQSQWLREETSESPLGAMTPEERLVADYAVSCVTTGPHPMWFSTESAGQQRILTCSGFRRLSERLMGEDSRAGLRQAAPRYSFRRRFHRCSR